MKKVVIIVVAVGVIANSAVLSKQVRRSSDRLICIQI